MGGVSAYLIPVVALVLSATPGLKGAETVWSGLVIAENVAEPQPIPAELTRIEEDGDGVPGGIAKEAGFSG